MVLWSWEMFSIRVNFGFFLFIGFWVIWGLEWVYKDFYSVLKKKLKIDFLDIKYQMAKLFGDHLVASTMFLRVWNYKFKVLGTMYGIQIVNIKFNIYFKIRNVLYSDKNPKHVPPPSLLLRRLDQHQNFQVRFGKSRSETNKCYIVVNNVFGDDLKTETTSVTQQEAPLTSFAVISNNKAFFSQSAAKWSKLQLCRENNL